MATITFLLRLLPLLCLATLCSCLADLVPRQSCAGGYFLCSPSGASFRDVPEIGPGLARLYVNLVETVNPQPAPAHLRGRSEEAPDASLADDLDPATLVCFTKGKKDASLATCCSKKGYGCLDLVGGSFLNTMFHNGDDAPECDKGCQCPQPFPRKSMDAKRLEGSVFGHGSLVKKQSTPGLLCCKFTSSPNQVQDSLADFRCRNNPMPSYPEL